LPRKLVLEHIVFFFGLVVVSIVFSSLQDIGSAVTGSKMFRNTFQSGFLSILYSIGSKPLQIWDKEGALSFVNARHFMSLWVLALYPALHLGGHAQRYSPLSRMESDFYMFVQLLRFFCNTMRFLRFLVIDWSLP
jgi:hypothetical protein